MTAVREANLEEKIKDTLQKHLMVEGTEQGTLAQIYPDLVKQVVQELTALMESHAESVLDGYFDFVDKENTKATLSDKDWKRWGVDWIWAKEQYKATLKGEKGQNDYVR